MRPIRGLVDHRGLVMVRQLSIAIAISICIGSGMARSDATAPQTKVGFDKAFADATPQGEFDPSIQEGLRRVGWNFIVAATEHGSQYVNRASKSDRLQSVLLEPAPLPYCEPVGSPFADPILRRIVGRCAA
jgi:hypothetical protein